MKKLPKRLKSGKRLVATAADRRVGLYRGGTREDPTWRVGYLSGKVKKGMMGSKDYPLAPEGQKWIWLRTKKRRKEERASKKARAHLDPRAGRLREKKRKKLPISKTQLCVDCGKHLLGVKHAHTIAHEERGYAVSICCRCTRKRGYKCPIRKQERIERKRAERRTFAASEKRRLKRVFKVLAKGRRLSKKEKIKILKEEGFTPAKKKKKKRRSLLL